jgi:hypothetical protein
MRRKVPGGATIQLGEMPPEKGDLPRIEAALVPVLLTLGSGVGINVVSKWLYDKLKGDGKERKMIRINRVLVEITPEAITKILAESVEIEDRK